MKGYTIDEFIDAILTMGGPEIEFAFRDKYCLLETLVNPTKNCLELRVEMYYNLAPHDKDYITTHYFLGKDFAECLHNFERSEIFDGLNIYQAEQEIEVLFG